MNQTLTLTQAKTHDAPLKRIGSLLSAHYIYIALLALMLLGAAISPDFLTTNNLRNLLAQTSILGIIAMAQFLVVLVGGFDLSVGAVLALCSVIFAVLASGHPPAFAAAAALGAGTSLGLLSGIAATLGRVPPMIATLGVAGIARGLAFIVTPKSVLVPMAIITPFRFVSGIFTTTMIAWFLLVAIFAWGLNSTRTGRHLYAIGGNENAARLAGIGVLPLKIGAYAAAGALSATAGILFVIRSYSGVPHVGSGWELETIAGIVIGGTQLFGGEGNIVKAMIGMLLYQAIGNLMNLTDISPYYQDVVKASVVVAVVGASILAARRRKGAA